MMMRLGSLENIWRSNAVKGVDSRWIRCVGGTVLEKAHAETGLVRRNGLDNFHQEAKVRDPIVYQYVDSLSVVCALACPA